MKASVGLAARGRLPPPDQTTGLAGGAGARTEAMSMREVMFALEFRGRAGEGPGGQRLARSVAKSQTLSTVIEPAGVSARVEAVAGESAVLESDKNHDMDSLASRHLGLKTLTYAEVCGKGAKQIGFGEVAVDRATPIPLR